MPSESTPTDWRCVEAVLFRRALDETCDTVSCFGGCHPEFTELSMAEMLEDCAHAVREEYDPEVYKEMLEEELEEA